MAEIIAKIMLSFLLSLPVAFVCYAVIYANNSKLDSALVLLLAIAGVVTAFYCATAIGDVWNSERGIKSSTPSKSDTEPK